MPKHRKRKSITFVYKRIPQNHFYPKVIQPKTMTNYNNESIRDEVTNVQLGTYSNNKTIQENFNNTKLNAHSNNKTIQENFNNTELNAHSNNKTIQEDFNNTKLNAHSNNKTIQEDFNNTKLNAHSNNKTIQEDFNNTKLNAHSNNKTIQEDFNNTKLNAHSKQKNIQNKLNNTHFEVHSNNKTTQDKLNNTHFEVHSNNKTTQDKFNNTYFEVYSNNKTIQEEVIPTELNVHANTLDIWDEIALREIQTGKYTSLFEEKSNYQNINLLQVNDLRLYLDKQLQFSSVDEQIYHEALVHPIMSTVEDPKHVLILGGGDALALREVLKYENVLHVDLVDLDEEMIRMARDIPEVVSLNQSALFDARVNVHMCDAMEFLQSHSLLYDVIIIDFPDPATELLSQLYTKEFFTLVSRFLAEGGALVCQSNSPADAPLVYWSIGKTIQSAGLTVKSYHTIVPSFGNDWGFHIAANQSAILKQIEQLSVTVPQRTLPPILSPLFQFRKELLEQRNQAVLNTQDNLTLHDCYRQDMQF